MDLELKGKVILVTGGTDGLGAALATRVPLGRIGNPSEFGDLAAFLLSSRASYITGAAINLDGGRNPVS